MTWRPDLFATLFLESTVFHIQKEEMGLLAAISALLDPEADAAMADTYRSEVG